MHFEAIVFAPLFHDLYEVLNLGVVGVLEHLDDFNESLVALFASDHHLEDTNCSSALAFPEFGIRVKSFKDVEGLRRVVELAHFVAVVRDQVQQRKGLV